MEPLCSVVWLSFSKAQLPGCGRAESRRLDSYTVEIFPRGVMKGTKELKILSRQWLPRWNVGFKLDVEGNEDSRGPDGYGKSREVPVRWGTGIPAIVKHAR